MKLALIPGINGRLGHTYSSALKVMPNFIVKGISRLEKTLDDCIVTLDLSDKQSCNEVIDNLDVNNISEIYLVHAVGPFLFEEEGRPLEDDNGDGIDDKVYEANVTTFLNIAKPLIKKVQEEPHKLKLTLCAFGSISDRYNVPYWQSYSKSKNILRGYIRSKVSEAVRGIFINVGSTEKEEERIHADKTYWLTCQEVVDRSMRAILDDGLNWQEIDIFKPNPYFIQEYYFRHEELKMKWIRDMYGSIKRGSMT
jgi:hypothetical protein